MSEAMDKEMLAKVAGMIRRNCTPSSEAYQRGGDALIYAVADWVENPPEWVLAAQPTEPAPGVAEDALADLRESIEQELELGGDASTLVPAVTEWLKRSRPVAALSTQPAAGEVETVRGDALRLVAAEFEQTEGLGLTADGLRWYAWAAEALRTRADGFDSEDRQASPSLAPELVPGTLAALDNLNIRPEDQ